MPTTPLQLEPEEIDEQTTAPTVTIVPLLWNISQVCASLGGISESKLRSMVSAGRFPQSVHIDRLVRWRPSDVAKWIETLKN